MTVPIVYQDEVIGTFNVESPEPNAFGPEDLRNSPSCSHANSPAACTR